MQSIDRWVGLALALLAGVVLWTSRDFPVVPGQKVGAGLLPGIVGAGLLVCGAMLVARSFRAVYGEPEARPVERYGAASLVIAVVLGYILLAERVGFLIVVPIGLVALFLAFKVRFWPGLLWALAGTAVVHIAFYKLLRVPLPWGVLRPLY